MLGRGCKIAAKTFEIKSAARHFRGKLTHKMEALICGAGANRKVLAWGAVLFGLGYA